jgi:endonuclease-3
MKFYDPFNLLSEEQCHTLFARFQAQNPNPTTQLHYTTPFELLIAIILSAKATDNSVNEVTTTLFKVANTPATLLALGENRFKEYIKNVGLYNNKTSFIFETCRRLLEKHGGEIPSERKALEALPGVGRKTANVILNIVFGQPTIAVDTHVFRVSNRTGLAPGRTETVVEAMLLKRVPDEYKKNTHYWLIEHGRSTCRALHPKCSNCMIEDLCLYSRKKF